VRFSLVYKSSSKTARTDTQRNLISKTNNNNRERERERERERQTDRQTDRQTEYLMRGLLTQRVNPWSSWRETWPQVDKQTGAVLEQQL
jgi:hypothetical protein